MTRDEAISNLAAARMAYLSALASSVDDAKEAAAGAMRAARAHLSFIEYRNQKEI